MYNTRTGNKGISEEGKINQVYLLLNLQEAFEILSIDAVTGKIQVEKALFLRKRKHFDTRQVILNTDNMCRKPSNFYQSLTNKVWPDIQASAVS